MNSITGVNRPFYENIRTHTELALASMKDCWESANCRIWRLCAAILFVWTFGSVGDS